MEPEHEQAPLRMEVSPASIESADNQPQEHTDLLLPSSSSARTGRSEGASSFSPHTMTMMMRRWAQQHTGRILVVVSGISILAMLGTLILIAIVSWKLFVLDTSTLAINIHVKISPQCEALAMEFNEKIQKLDVSEAINLTTLQMPHITLYLTNFMYLRYSEIDQAMNQIVSKMRRCNVTMSNQTTVSGEYVMWNVEASGCLQQMSDAIVNETSAFIEAHQAVPDWVQNISDPGIREKRKRYVEEFGSPNVFDMFSPHVTLAADSKSPSALADAASKLSITSCTFSTEKIALGSVGEFGTVLRNEDMDVFTIGTT